MDRELRSPELRSKERARGYILRILIQSYPNVMDATVIYFLLADLGMPMSKDHFNFHLGYLLEKKYIREEKRSAGTLSIRMIAITAAGVDCMDNRQDDNCGVDTSV